MYHVNMHTVCFQTFSVKRKENDLHRKYTFLEGPAENASTSTISQIKKIYDFISFTNTRSIAQISQFFELLKNKI